MRAQKNALEWAVFGVSLLLVLAAVAGLVIDATSGDASPPELVVTVGAAQRAGGLFRLPVQVENRGDTTAQAATIEVALHAGGREVERAEIALDFVPRRASRRGWVAFRSDPRCCEIVARPLGFEAP